MGLITMIAGQLLDTLRLQLAATQSELALIQATQYVQFPRWMLDAFGRVRVTSPANVFDSKLLFDNQPLLWGDVEASGGSTSSTYNANQASVTLGVGSTTAGKRIRQTFRSFPYQAGKSCNIMLTGIIGNPTPGITVEIGPNDGKDGLLFQSQGSAQTLPLSSYVNNVNLVRRSYTNGASAVDTAVPQSAWNLDTLSGYGGTANPSGIKADWTKVQIFGFDYQYLGTGSVFAYVVINGLPINVHRFDQANTGTLVYMSKSNLPLRFSIENDGTGAATTMTAMCSAVQMEGGLDALGQPLSIERGSSGLTTGADTSIYPLVCYRLRSGYAGSIVTPLGGWMTTSAASISYRWALLLNPTFTGGIPSYSSIASTSSGLESATPANTITVSGGTVLASGVGSTTQPAVIPPLQSDWRPGGTSGGTADQVVLAVQNIVAAANTFFGGANVREVY